MSSALRVSWSCQLLLLLPACHHGSVAPAPGFAGSTILAPSGGLVSRGPLGGPFTPVDRTYVLTNDGPGSLDFRIEATEPWAWPSAPLAGSLPAGQSVQLTVALDGTAITGLAPGVHMARVNLRDELSGRILHGVDVELHVEVPGSSGWTELTPSPDTRMVYVSPTGSDFQDGLTPSTAKRSINAGMNLLRDGFPDWLLLERGGVWEANLQMSLSGRSKTEPLVIGSYGTGPRPRLETPVGTDGISNYRGGVEHVRVVGLELTSKNYDGTGSVPAGIFLLGWFNDLLFEDLYIHNYASTVVIQNQVTDPAQYMTDIRLRRSIMARAYKVGDNQHPQGIYAEGIDGFLLEECTFYRCGFDPDVPGSNATIFRHTCYFQVQTKNVTARRNITLETSSHGYQFRGSNTFADDNLLVRVPIAILVGSGDDPGLTPDGGASGIIQNNVILDGRDIGGNPRGFGFATNNLVSATVRGNVFAHTQLTHDFSSPFWFGRQNHPENVGVNNLTIEDNVVYNWRGHLLSADSSSAHGTYTNISFFDNQLQSSLAQVTAPWILSMDAGHPLEWSSGGNEFYNINPSDRDFAIGGAYYDLAGWMAQVGDMTSVENQVSYVDPLRTPQLYVDHLEQLPPGTSTFQDFVDIVLGQSMEDWDPRYTAGAINAWIRAGFVER